MVIVWNAAIVSIAMVWSIWIIHGVLTGWTGFPLWGCSWLSLGWLILNVFSVRQCCEKPETVFVWIIPAMTVSCSGGLLKYSQALWWVIARRLGTEAHSPPLWLPLFSTDTTTIKHLIRPRRGQDIKTSVLVRSVLMFWTPRGLMRCFIVVVLVENRGSQRAGEWALVPNLQAISHHNVCEYLSNPLLQETVIAGMIQTNRQPQ